MGWTDLLRRSSLFFLFLSERQSTEIVLLQTFYETVEKPELKVDAGLTLKSLNQEHTATVHKLMLSTNMSLNSKRSPSEKKNIS